MAGCKVKKRGLVYDNLLGIIDEGRVVHLPTGRVVNPPPNPEGGYIPVRDLHAYVNHMLGADPEAWEESRQLAWNTSVEGSLKARLHATRLSYRGD